MRKSSGDDTAGRRQGPRIIRVTQNVDKFAPCPTGHHTDFSMNTDRIPLKGFLPAAALLLFATTSHAALVHRWSFDDGSDSVGGATASLVGGASFAGGQLELPGGAPRTNYAEAPGISSTLSANPSVTVEAWFTMDALT